MEIDLELSTKLALSCNILGREGQSDMTLVHVSVRMPGQNRLLMKPHGLGLEEVRREDIILIDFDGNKLAGERRRHTEYPLHTEIYKFRSEINCVVHTHPPHATILGAAGGRIHAISHEGTLFLNLPVFQDTTELISTPSQGEDVARCLGQARAVLLRNHGVVVVGRSIEEGTINAILLEKAAKMEYLSRQIASPTWSSEEESYHKVEQIYGDTDIQSYWDYYVRKWVSSGQNFKLRKQRG